MTGVQTCALPISDRRFADLLDGKDLLHDEALRNHRFEFVEHNVDRVNFLAGVAGDHVFGQRRGLRKSDLVQNADMLSRYLNRCHPFGGRSFGINLFCQFSQVGGLDFGGGKTAAEEIPAFAADRLDVNILAWL